VSAISAERFYSNRSKYRIAIGASLRPRRRSPSDKSSAVEKRCANKARRYVGALEQARALSCVSRELSRAIFTIVGSPITTKRPDSVVVSRPPREFDRASVIFIIVVVVVVIVVVVGGGGGGGGGGATARGIAWRVQRIVRGEATRTEKPWIGVAVVFVVVVGGGGG